MTWRICLCDGLAVCLPAKVLGLKAKYAHTFSDDQRRSAACLVRSQWLFTLMMERDLSLAKYFHSELFVTTKHWRKFHGYEPALACLRTSLKRLQLPHVDLWLMHWPGPAWSTMSRRKDEIAEHGRFHYAAPIELTAALLQDCGQSSFSLTTLARVLSIEVFTSRPLAYFPSPMNHCRAHSASYI